MKSCLIRTVGKFGNCIHPDYFSGSSSQILRNHWQDTLLPSQPLDPHLIFQIPTQSVLKPQFNINTHAKFQIRYDLNSGQVSHETLIDFEPTTVLQHRKPFAPNQFDRISVSWFKAPENAEKNLALHANTPFSNIILAHQCQRFTFCLDQEIPWFLDVYDVYSCPYKNETLINEIRDPWMYFTFPPKLSAVVWTNQYVPIQDMQTVITTHLLPPCFQYRRNLPPTHPDRKSFTVIS